MRSRIFLILFFLPAFILAQSWKKTRVGECTFLIPDMLELQDPNGIMAKLQQQIKPFNTDEVIIYQSSGLNSKDNLESISASLNFTQVVLRYVKQDQYPESFLENYPPRELVKLNEVAERILVNEYKKNFPRGRVIWYGLKKIYINGKACIVKKFEGPSVIDNKNIYVEEYSFITRENDVTFTFSTLASDWKMRETLYKIVKSICFD